MARPLRAQAGSADGRERSASIAVEVVEGDPPTLVSGCSPPWLCTQIQGAQLVIPAKLILECRCEVEVRDGTPGFALGASALMPGGFVWY